MKPLYALVLWLALPIITTLVSLGGAIQEVNQTGLCPQTPLLPAEPCTLSDFWFKRVLGTSLGWRTYLLEWLSWTVIMAIVGAVWWGYQRIKALGR